MRGDPPSQEDPCLQARICYLEGAGGQEEWTEKGLSQAKPEASFSASTRHCGKGGRGVQRTEQASTWTQHPLCTPPPYPPPRPGQCRASGGCHWAWPTLPKMPPPPSGKRTAHLPVSTLTQHGGQWDLLLTSGTHLCHLPWGL